MNQKLLIIIFISALIVCMAGLIYIKGKQLENFHPGDINCNDINQMNVCNAFDGCRVVDENCLDICKFNPADDLRDSNDRDDRDYTAAIATAYGLEQSTGGAPDSASLGSLSFSDENSDGAFTTCFRECEAFEETSNSDQHSVADLNDSECRISDCRVKCREYVLKKASDRTVQVDRSYHPFPTNRFSEEEYIKFKDTILTQMVDGESDTAELRNAIRDEIYGEHIDLEKNRQSLMVEETDKLTDVMNKLKNLNSSGSNFIKQVDQIGDFQDKYSQRLEELLESKRGSNSALQTKLGSLQNKLDEMTSIYNRFNTGTVSSVPQLYRSMRNSANSKILNLTPVGYSADTNGSNREYYKNGAYMINITNKNAGNVTGQGILYVEPKTSSDDFCNPNDAGCSYELNYQSFDRNNALNDDLSVSVTNASSLHGGQDVADVSFIVKGGDNEYEKDYNDATTNAEYMFKRQAYFHVKEINNNDEYNGILISANKSDTRLVTGDTIKYPFYVLESLELPGHLISIEANRTSSTERFFIKLKATGRADPLHRFNAYSDADGAGCF